MVLVERAVGLEVAHCPVWQRKAVCNGAGGLCGQGNAGAFQDVDHAEQPYRVAPCDQVVEISDHELDRLRGSAVAYRLPVAPTGLDVVEDPLFMAVFFLDVLAHGTAQPFEPGGQARPACHHQRDGVAHVVVGLGEKCDVAVEADLPSHGLADHRNAEQRLALMGGLQLQRFKEGHGELTPGVCGSEIDSVQESPRAEGGRWLSGFDR